jgi:hypothetical protein
MRTLLTDLDATTAEQIASPESQPFSDRVSSRLKELRVAPMFFHSFDLQFDIEISVVWVGTEATSLVLMTLLLKLIMLCVAGLLFDCGSPHSFSVSPMRTSTFAWRVVAIFSISDGDRPVGLGI